MHHMYAENIDRQWNIAMLRRETTRLPIDYRLLMLFMNMKLCRVQPGQFCVCVLFGSSNYWTMDIFFRNLSVDSYIRTVTSGKETLSQSHSLPLEAIKAQNTSVSKYGQKSTKTRNRSSLYPIMVYRAQPIACHAQQAKLSK